MCYQSTVRSTKKTHYCVITLFNVIAASRPVNKNVSSCTVTRAKSGTEPGVHKLQANYQTGFGYKFRPIYERLVRNLILPRRVYERTETKSTQA